MEIAARIKRLLPSNRFARSVSILAGGTAAGQAIVVLASPILTRLYTPEDFGLLAVYAALLGIISVVASCVTNSLFHCRRATSVRVSE